jgi:chromosome segregation ATPase
VRRLKKIFKLVGILVVIALISVGYFFLYQKLKTETSLRKLTEKNLEIQRKQNLKLKLEINSLEGKIKEKEDAINKRIQENENLKNAVKQLNETLNSVESELSLATQEKQALLTKLSKQTKKLEELENNIKSLIDERELLRQRLAGLKPKRRILTKKEVKLKKVKVEEKAKILKAQIMAINEEYSFLVLNLGEKDGIDKSKIYNIEKNEKLIASLKPDRIYENLSVFDIIKQNEKLSEGQEVELFPVENVNEDK